MVTIRVIGAAIRAAWRAFWLLDEEDEIAGAQTIERKTLERVSDPQTQPIERPRKWRALRHGGGGIFDTPVLTENQAIDYVTRRGSHSITHVDRENSFIFYR